MVTYTYDNDTKKYHFDGLSTDTKPDTIAYPDLTNGSSFLEIDSKDTLYWDAAGETWV